MDAALPLSSRPAPRFHPAAERAYGAAAGAAGAPRMENAKLRKVADDFETQFLGQMLAPMFETVETDPVFGGGHGEEMFRSLLVNEYGKQMTQRGGFGIADAVYRELLRAQEGRQA